MKPAAVGLAMGVALGLSTGSLADDLKADQKFTESGVSFDLKGPYSNVTLTIAGPDGFHASAFAKSGAPSIDLGRFGAMQDGTYTYQLTAATEEAVKSRSALDDGRDRAAAAQARRGVAASGTFLVKDGAIVKRGAQPGKRDQN